jgi:hypothetical protein
LPVKYSALAGMFNDRISARVSIKSTCNCSMANIHDGPFCILYCPIGLKASSGKLPTLISFILLFICGKYQQLVTLIKLHDHEWKVPLLVIHS